MKNWLFFLFLVFLIPIQVKAEDLKLNSLSIKNGELSIPFDPLNTSYTILLDKDIEKVDFLYEVENDVSVTIQDNINLQNNSIVTLIIKNASDTVNYTFQILKEEEEIKEVFLEEKPEEKLNFMYQYKIYIIPAICFILLFLSYKVIFWHKK